MPVCSVAPAGMKRARVPGDRRVDLGGLGLRAARAVPSSRARARRSRRRAARGGARAAARRCAGSARRPRRRAGDRDRRRRGAARRSCRRRAARASTSRRRRAARRRSPSPAAPAARAAARSGGSRRDRLELVAQREVVHNARRRVGITVGVGVAVCVVRGERQPVVIALPELELQRLYSDLASSVSRRAKVPVPAA